MEIVDFMADFMHDYKELVQFKPYCYQNGDFNIEGALFKNVLNRFQYFFVRLVHI